MEPFTSTICIIPSSWAVDVNNSRNYVIKGQFQVDCDHVWNKFIP